MLYLLLNVVLPFIVSIGWFALGMRAGRNRRMKAIGQYPYWAAIVVLSWGWAVAVLLGLPNCIEYQRWFSLSVIGASGLPAGAAYAVRKSRKWVAVLPTSAVFIYLLFAFGTSCCYTRRPEKPTGPRIFSVLTYNINWGSPRPNLAVKVILEADADVVCLQETTPEWETYLRSELSDRYPFGMFRHYSGAGGVAFLAKKPVVDKKYVSDKAGWFPGWIIQADTPLGPVQILSVHLRPPLGESGGLSLSAYFSIDDIHLQEVKDLYPHLERDMPTIILGDFNEGNSGDAIKWLKNKGMMDALPEFDPFAKTWRWQTRLATMRACFDHILYSDHLYCLEARVIKAGGSDHFPVIAVFEDSSR
jgi:endonuclease/exonuclease/phosphatase family metal-dependent hydrolase